MKEHFIKTKYRLPGYILTDLCIRFSKNTTMKSNYFSAYPLMKISPSTDMMSSRPQHETSQFEVTFRSKKDPKKWTSEEKFIKK